MLFFLLASCSSSPTKTPELEKSYSSQALKNLTIGISPGNAIGVYSLVSNKNGKWKVDSMTDKPVNRKDHNQEVIFINRGFNYASPAYFYTGVDLGHGFKPYLKSKDNEYGYQCVDIGIVGGVLTKLPGKSYDPCSRTVLSKGSSDSTATATKTLMLVMTMGIGGFYKRVVDENMIKKIIIETGLIEKSKNFCKNNMNECNKVSRPNISSAYANMKYNYDPEEKERKQQRDNNADPEILACAKNLGAIDGARGFDELTHNARIGATCRKMQRDKNTIKRRGY